MSSNQYKEPKQLPMYGTATYVLFEALYQLEWSINNGTLKKCLDHNIHFKVPYTVMDHDDNCYVLEHREYKPLGSFVSNVTNQNYADIQDFIGLPIVPKDVCKGLLEDPSHFYDNTLGGNPYWSVKACQTMYVKVAIMIHRLCGARGRLFENMIPKYVSKELMKVYYDELSIKPTY